jgi:hypothetical protein
MTDKIIEASFTSEEPVNLKAAAIICTKLQRYNEIEQIIEEYKKGNSSNVFTNDKYFRRILEVFEVD